MIGKIVDKQGRTLVVLTDRREWSGPLAIRAQATVPDYSPSLGHPVGLLDRALPAMPAGSVIVVAPAVAAELRRPTPPNVVY